MKSRFLQKRSSQSIGRKIRQAIIIPTLTLVLMAAQLAPQLFFSNQAVMELINELPTTAVVYAAPLTEEELEAYPDEAPTVKEVGNKNNLMNDERTLVRVKYNNSTGKSEVYLTTHGYQNYPELRQALEDEYGLKFMLSNPSSALADSYSRWADILSSKSERKKLAKIAAKYIPDIKASYAAAPEIALATYYGAINDPWDYVKYSNNKAITRQQMCALVYRFWTPNWGEFQVNLNDGIVKTMGKTNKYNLYLSATNRYMYGAGVKYVASNGNIVGKYDKKAMNSSATRKEVLYLAMEYYHQGGWGLYDNSSGDSGKYNEAYINKAIKEAKKLFKDLKDEGDLLIAYRLYTLGIIKPDKNGNSNLNKKCSMSLALRYVFAARGVELD